MPPTLAIGEHLKLGFVDINECEGSPCSENGECLNTNGSFICACGEGYTGDGIICEGCYLLYLLSTLTVFCGPDIDECMIEMCFNNTTCSNTIGNFSCICNAGYAMTELNKCTGTKIRKLLVRILS